MSKRKEGCAFPVSGQMQASLIPSQSGGSSLRKQYPRVQGHVACQLLPPDPPLPGRRVLIQPIVTTVSALRRARSSFAMASMPTLGFRLCSDYAGKESHASTRAAA